MTDTALAKLRLGMPMDALASAAGTEWTPPGPRDEGNFWIKRESGVRRSRRRIRAFIMPSP